MTRDAPPGSERRDLPGQAHPRRGRSLDPEVTASIKRAARALLVERGYEGASWVQIAARAEVARTSLYQRWRGKEELVVDALLDVMPAYVAPDTGAIRTDLLALIGREAELVQGELGALVRALVGPMAQRADLRRAFRQRIRLPRRQVFLEVIRRGAERGELRQGVDGDLLVEALSGPVVLGMLLAGEPLEAARLERHVDQVLAGVRPPGAAAGDAPA